MGNCYEAAASALLFRRQFADWVLVHGHPTRTIEPYCQFGHAWLEQGDTVFDAASRKVLRRNVYYQAGQIDYRDNRLYTEPEARAFIQLTQHWGPWEGPDAEDVPDRRVKEWLRSGRPLPKRSLKAKP